MTRWKHRPEGSTWGDFGEDDELGRLNLLTEAKILEAVSEVQAGKVFCLSLPLDLPGGSVLNPRRRAPELKPTLRGSRPVMNFLIGDDDRSVVDVISDDQVTISLQYSTQWDGLSHVGARFDVDGTGREQLVYYNGYRAGIDVLGGDASGDCRCAGDHSQPTIHGARKLSIHRYAEKGIQGRGVLVDLVREYGMGRTLVGYDKLMFAIDRTKAAIGRGDMLVIRTGFAEAIVGMAGEPDADVLNRTGAVFDGSDEKLLDWISASGIAAICADNYAVEQFPAATTGPRRSLLPLHHHCLFKLGVPLAELWYLKDLADWLYENGRASFLLTAPPLRLPGAVGSPVTPIATV
jgi:kynurenine formamidase